MRKLFLPLLLVMLMNSAFAQVTDPEITSWMQNTTATNPSYPSILSNCQLVQYSANNVYVSCTCIPGYAIGPFNGNPNVPSNQNFVYKITRNPQPETGAKTAVGMGHIGVLKNGVSLFNVYDGYWWDSTTNAWNSAPSMTHHTWNRNALKFEYPSFDNCIGHPQQQGEYHHHVSPKCLYDQTDSTHHSPLIGYAFDGYPIYGAYGYATANNASSGIKRMKSSYVLTTNTTRTNGPSTTTYPLGDVCEDFIYTNGAGDLDASNGRYCVTPEYPNGTYAYFMTLDASLNPTFPYTFYGSYYGVVQSGNTGPNSGQNTITETVTTYTPTSMGVEELKNQTLDFYTFPNPTNTMLHIFIQPIYSNDFTVELYDMMGRKMLSKNNVHPTITESLDVHGFAAGNYILKIYNSEFSTSKKVEIGEQ
jgi:YHYH protein/Secretion system C-terminal sorting domain